MKKFEYQQFEKRKPTGMRVSESGGFVRIIHKPSGIHVTKYDNRDYITAREEAEEEISYLVDIWERKI